MFQIERPVNEPVRSYKPGSTERDTLKNQLNQMAKQLVEIPCYVGGEEIRTGDKRTVVMPHEHRHVLAEFHWAGPTEIKLAIKAALQARPAWEEMPWNERAAVFLKAADLVSGPYRDLLNAATMLGQSKNVYQAEVDAACELSDFLRYNAYFYQQLIQEQPFSSPGVWNRVEYRGLEGFVAAITPFNFTAIAGNLPAAPALLGNTVIWKPSDTQMLAAHYTMQVFREAGLPSGVINLVPADGPLFGKTVLSVPDLAGIHFTGSTATFQTLWAAVGENIRNYHAYPRLVGETGGKGFVFAHPSADAHALATALVRGAFEYQGQKCSAASRAYIPRSLWKSVRDRTLEQMHEISVGDVRDFKNFMNAVIDHRSFKKISNYLEQAKNSSDVKILIGGKGESDKGYFIEPTLFQVSQPTYPSMIEEIFGPVLSVFVYDDLKYRETLQICQESSAYALTGAVFAQDRLALDQMTQYLRYAAGNFYVNDKPTGAIVGQQPFGGGRSSGTNDKAGSSLNLYRWLSARTIKETFIPAKDYRYPFLDAE